MENQGISLPKCYLYNQICGDRCEREKVLYMYHLSKNSISDLDQTTEGG